ncbi:MAG: hypothetical protein AAF368_18150, partial [Planctomycetota bacterium]
LGTIALRGSRCGGSETNPRVQLAGGGEHGLGLRDGRRCGTDALRGDRCGVSAAINSQDVANTLWAFACVAWAHNQGFLELGAAIAERVGDLEDID